MSLLFAVYRSSRSGVLAWCCATICRGWSLRVEGSSCAMVSWKHCAHAVRARDTASYIHAGDVAGLSNFAVGRRASQTTASHPRTMERNLPRPDRAHGSHDANVASARARIARG